MILISLNNMAYDLFLEKNISFPLLRQTPSTKGS